MRDVMENAKWQMKIGSIMSSLNLFGIFIIAQEEMLRKFQHDTGNHIVVQMNIGSS